MSRCPSFLIFSAVLFAAVPTWGASENSITVIQEDGTKVTIELDPVEPVLPGPQPLEQPAPVEARPAPVKDIIPAPKPYVDEIVAPPVREEAAPEEKPATKSKEKKQAKTKEAAKKKKPVNKEAGAYEYSIPPGTVINESLAASIAMDSAPPSSGYTVSRKSYQGADAFVVTFKTEDGPYDVLVDSASGKILLSAYVETHNPAPTKPGHLPEDWKPYEPQSLRPKKQ